MSGPPSFVQDAEYPDCSICGQAMRFLLQLDSDLPTDGGDEWLWGSGGIGNVFWCDRCRRSAYLWQCT